MVSATPAPNHQETRTGQVDGADSDTGEIMLRLATAAGDRRGGNSDKDAKAYAPEQGDRGDGALRIQTARTDQGRRRASLEPAGPVLVDAQAFNKKGRSRQTSERAERRIRRTKEVEMKTLRLPEPARSFWLTSRPVLDSLMPKSEGWRRHLGGGTILAARLQHRESTDIDIVVGGGGSLKRISREIATRINGHVEINEDDQITITRTGNETHKGKLDISKVEILPETGQAVHLVEGSRESVLSTAQILRGKLARGLKPGPVRDAYDIIRSSKADHETQAALVTACGHMRKTDVKAIERLLKRSNTRLKERALESLKLTEESVVDFSLLGTTAGKAIQGHRLRRVVVRLQDGSVVTERHTINGKKFETSCSPNRVRETWERIGIRIELESTGIGIDRLKKTLDIHLGRHRSATVIRTRSGNVRDQVPVLQRGRDEAPGKGWSR